MAGSDRKKPDRDAILSRRKIFIASALAAAATTDCNNPFRPCLEIAPADATAPMPCLSAPPRPVDASAVTADADADVDPDAGDANDAADASDARRGAARTTTATPKKPPPRPCLSQLPTD